MPSDTKLIGILNLTPDSFSDGNAYAAPEAALRRIEQMINEGARVIDVGAESTRPGAVLLSHEEEWKRLAPVLEALPKNPEVEISIDTRHAKTAAKALALGAQWINDVSGLNTPEMLEVLKKHDCKVVLMHSLSVPADKNVVMAEDTDVIDALITWAEKRMNALEKSGIKKDRIIFDPGIGFGKTAKQSMQIIKSAKLFKALGVPLLYGHSRKSFLSLVTNKPAKTRDPETAVVSAYLAKAGVDYLRVHNITANMDALSKPFTCPHWLKNNTG